MTSDAAGVGYVMLGGSKLVLLSTPSPYFVVEVFIAVTF